MGTLPDFSPTRGILAVAYERAVWGLPDVDDAESSAAALPLGKTVDRQVDSRV